MALTNKNLNVRASTEDQPVVELGTDIQKWIADRLIEMFDEVVQQGVPDRFAELLKQLDDHSHEGK